MKWLAFWLYYCSVFTLQYKAAWSNCCVIWHFIIIFHLFLSSKGKYCERNKFKAHFVSFHVQNPNEVQWISNKEQPLLQTRAWSPHQYSITSPDLSVPPPPKVHIHSRKHDAEGGIKKNKKTIALLVKMVLLLLFSTLSAQVWSSSHCVCLQHCALSVW